MYATIAGSVPIVPSLEQKKDSIDLHLRLEKFFTLKNTGATPLLSESYRNAIAISIFLSAALQRKPAARFIILDDVTSSFDAGHQFALMEVLRTQVGLPLNPDGLQVVILSHDGLLEKYFDKYGNSNEWHHQHLQGLPPLGSMMMQASGAERLKASAETFLNAGQIKQAEPLIRQHLELRLLQIISKVAIPVSLDFAIKDNMKMVGICSGVLVRQTSPSLDGSKRSKKTGRRTYNVPLPTERMMCAGNRATETTVLRARSRHDGMEG